MHGVIHYVILLVKMTILKSCHFKLTVRIGHPISTQFLLHRELTHHSTLDYKRLNVVPWSLTERLRNLDYPCALTLNRLNVGPSTVSLWVTSCDFRYQALPLFSCNAEKPGSGLGMRICYTSMKDQFNCAGFFVTSRWSLMYIAHGS